MAQLRGGEWVEWQNNVGYDKNWAEADPVTLLPRPSVQACLSLFHISYKEEQEKIRVDVFGDKEVNVDDMGLGEGKGGLENPRQGGPNTLFVLVHSNVLWEWANLGFTLSRMPLRYS